MTDPEPPPRPADVCHALLAALNASDGRSHSRKRDQAPDAIGLALRRILLERAAGADPEPQAFEGWLLDQVEASDNPGALRAVALAVLEEWRLAQLMPAFAHWLAQGAPSDDSRTGEGRSRS